MRTGVKYKTAVVAMTAAVVVGIGAGASAASNLPVLAEPGRRSGLDPISPSLRARLNKARASCSSSLVAVMTGRIPSRDWRQ